MGKNTSQLYFEYPSTARIKIKLENVYYADEWPGIYAVVTKKLTFIVPRVAVKMTSKHAYIPLSIYRDALNIHYSGLRRQPEPIRS